MDLCVCQYVVMWMSYAVFLRNQKKTLKVCQPEDKFTSDCVHWKSTLTQALTCNQEALYNWYLWAKENRLSSINSHCAPCIIFRNIYVYTNAYMHVISIIEKKGRPWYWIRARRVWSEKWYKRQKKYFI